MAARVRLLSWASLAYMTVEGAVASLAGVTAGPTALIGFGLDSAIDRLGDHRLALHRRSRLLGRRGAAGPVRTILQEQRNGAMYTAERPFWDNRLIRLWGEGANASDSIMALHVGIGGMIMSELQRREAAELTGPDDVRPTT